MVWTTAHYLPVYNELEIMAGYTIKELDCSQHSWWVRQLMEEQVCSPKTTLNP